MKKKSALLAFLLAGVMSFSVFASACKVAPSGPSGDNNTETELNTDTAISLVAGQSTTLTASAGVTWASSDTEVATVNGSGLVTAKKKGVTKITASKKGEKVTCTVIVLDAYEGSSSGGSVKNPFSFNESIQINSVQGSVGGPSAADPNAEEYTVRFSDGAITQYVAKDGLAVEPLVEKDGYFLKGWYTDSGHAAYYNFNDPVTANLDLEADWGDSKGLELVKGNEESIALKWSGSKTDVEYKLHSESDWKKVDEELVRENGGSVRADILGLKAGTYDVKANGKTIEGIPVKAYDRSGYAHFKYTDGIGAYNDDGTLKNNALVIYVTNENKDTVMKDMATSGNPAYDSDVAAAMFAIPYCAESTGGKNWNKNAEGIGWWLNNNQYTTTNSASKKKKVPSNTYSTGGGSLGFKNNSLKDRPVVIRFIGTVTSPEGLTCFNDVYEGGSVGDNGNLARMKNLKNITLEGVGDDAEIKGWGFHFIAGTDAVNGQGTSFEVRNLTFNEYPEDAVGMEGQAESSKITAPVERCWIHHNTFLPGRCDNPAESDKKEGDGSCDFKRGYYFTAAYNYFEYCHKTNLIGSSDSSLQYNMTYHHNIWYQCGSRIPLTRQANVHFYNNYVFGDPAEKTTPYSHISKPALSYVHSLRANCYLFSEANYYEGCKNVSKDTGGTAKAYNNTFYACSDGGTGTLTLVNERTQTVANSCKDPTPTRGKDYKNFDTDSTLFYYDSVNKKSECLLDDSISARLRTIFYAGAQGHGEKTKKMQQMNTSAPVSNPSITKATKGKGQVYTFSVESKSDLIINATGETPQIIRSDGKLYQEAFSGEVTVTLDPGIYIVCAGKKDKEITINSLSFEEDPEQAKANRLSEAERLIGAIPATITKDSGSIIDQATGAYNKLRTDEVGELTSGLAEKLAQAQTAYETISVNYVIARINYIGTVTIDSKNDIEEATKAYAALSAAAKAKVTNYGTLTTATATFEGFAIDSVAFELNRLPASTALSVLLDSKVAVEFALELYNSALQAYSEIDIEDLTDEEEAKLNATDVKAAIALLNSALNLAEFRELLKGFADNPTITKEDKAQVAELKAAYSALTESQQNGLTAAEKAKYQAIDDGYNALFAGRQAGSFAGGVSSNEVFQITGSAHNNRDEKNWPIPDGEGAMLDAGMKFETDTEITFVTSSTKTLTLYFTARSASNKIKIDGTSYTISTETIGGYTYSVLVIENLAAGTHKITKDSSNVDIMYAVLDD